MKPESPTDFDRALAKICLNCPVCRRARQKQKGAAFWLTAKVESRICPFCQAYQRVYGRRSHEPLVGPAAKEATLKSLDRQVPLT